MEIAWPLKRAISGANTTCVPHKKKMPMLNLSCYLLSILVQNFILVDKDDTDADESKEGKDKDEEERNPRHDTYSSTIYSPYHIPIPSLLQIHSFSSVIVIVCIYAYAYTFLNTACSVYVMLPGYMCLELTLWHWRKHISVLFAGKATSLNPSFPRLLLQFFLLSWGFMGFLHPVRHVHWGCSCLVHTCAVL